MPGSGVAKRDQGLPWGSRALSVYLKDGKHWSRPRSPVAPPQVPPDLPRLSAPPPITRFPGGAIRRLAPPPFQVSQWAPGPRAVCLRPRQGNLREEKSLYRVWKGKSEARNPAAGEEDAQPQVRAPGPGDPESTPEHKERPQRQPPSPVAVRSARV
ncbi:hypothetical protein NN561_006639 [Cricetulus griseus]